MNHPFTPGITAGTHGARVRSVMAIDRGTEHGTPGPARRGYA
jgi:hypothetical protein